MILRSGRWRWSLGRPGYSWASLLVFLLINACILYKLFVATSELSIFEPRHWTDPHFCAQSCATGQPCEYPDEVDFRLISIVYDRYASLEKHLKRILALDTLGDRISVEVWIDRAENGTISADTWRVAREFARKFVSSGKGRACVHNQTGHADIIGQWIDSWRPKPNTKEVSLILEDDIDVSVHTWRWVRAAAKRFLSQPHVGGITLQMENILYWDPLNRVQIHAPEDDTVFLFPCLGVWGYAPNPASWSDFQDWYHTVKTNASFRPMIPLDMIPTQAYKRFGDSMWEMWHMYFSYIRREWSVYPNLYAFTGREDVLLGTNRLELGLHYKTLKNVRDDSYNLLKDWDEKYVTFPENPAYFWYDGKRITSVAS